MQEDIFSRSPIPPAASATCPTPTASGATRRTAPAPVTSRHSNSTTTANRANPTIQTPWADFQPIPGPCSPRAASKCDRAWRWNLDYVVDPHGNTMSYWYDTATNNYKSIGTNKVETYVRSGQVDHVVYGTRVEPNLATGKDTVFTGHDAARIDYTYADRCLSDCTTHDAAHWPDTPWDLSCSSTTSCDARMPSFWTTRRLTTVKTSVYDALSGKFATSSSGPSTTRSPTRATPPVRGCG